MSKMSEIAMLLDDQAMALGFESYDEALAKGYDVCYGEDGAYLYKLQPKDEQLEAYKAWLKEKEKVLEEQKGLHDHLIKLGYDTLAKNVFHAIQFIEGVRSE